MVKTLWFVLVISIIHGLLDAHATPPRITFSGNNSVISMVSGKTDSIVKAEIVFAFKLNSYADEVDREIEIINYIVEKGLLTRNNKNYFEEIEYLKTVGSRALNSLPLEKLNDKDYIKRVIQEKANKYLSYLADNLSCTVYVLDVKVYKISQMGVYK